MWMKLCFVDINLESIYKNILFCTYFPHLNPHIFIIIILDTFW